jgi:uncharacterized paraquat-inducible protein A
MEQWKYTITFILSVLQTLVAASYFDPFALWETEMEDGKELKAGRRWT